MPAAPIVRLEAAGKQFGEHWAVRGIDLAVPAGCCFGLLGPNGAGKTTTLRMIYGATRPSEGRVRVFGFDVANEPRAVRSRLGMTLQEDALLEEVSPRANLRIFGRHHLLREPELSARVEELLDHLELRSHADLPVRALSGGFKRRLAIARSLMNRPELLVLDEPTTGLDPAVRQALWSSIRALRRSGTTILLTTHYMDEAERLCDRVAIFAQGRIVAEGSPAELVALHLAAQALEVEHEEGDGRARSGLLADLAADPTCVHALTIGSRTILYAADTAPLLARLHATPAPDAQRAIARPTNLEDVFLRLTGSSISEDAP